MSKENSIHIKLDPSKRVLFLTKDLSLIAKQLNDGLDLSMSELRPSDLLDDINTDIMTPAWVCFHHDPKEIAKRAYAGLMYNNERVFQDNALLKGNFQAIVSGERKGTGSSRETAAQCEKFSGVGLIFAASFAPIHQRNNINLGQIMGNYELLRRLEAGESIALEEFLEPFDEFSRHVLRAGGLFNFLNQFQEQQKTSPAILSEVPMTMAQKIMAKKLLNSDIQPLQNGQSTVAHVDGGYSHEFTSAQVHQFLIQEYGEHYKIKNAQRFAAFEDHLIYADEVPKYAPYKDLIDELRSQQKQFIAHTGIRDYSATQKISPGICHEVARQEFILPGDFIQATDSHTCMGGALNAFAFGIGATEYAALLATGLSVVSVPPSVRFDLNGSLAKNCSAKDVMLYILLNFSKDGLTLNKVMEFGGEGLHQLSIDERATLCNMATECGAKTGICEPDQKLVDWLLEKRKEHNSQSLTKLLSMPDKNCHYEARYSIDLSKIEPMVAHPGNPDLGIPSDPTNGELIKNLGEIPIDIAYGGSCTAGKYDDIEMYARVVSDALTQGKKVHDKVKFYIQYGSKDVDSYAKLKGFHDLFLKAGIKVISPGCGACIGCGPGVSSDKNQVSISAINRNFQGRSGPGKLYLASPLSVAASAFAGKIVAWRQ
ncbi:MAG: aconitate hydratase [Myxococcales bacterium]|nr:aconitate hydratase [Myxococcales bacterium]USN51089.1 MAG: aconitate hydratase [Myxococcales bacterium]